MALRGNLRDFTVTQILNLINLARKTGTLVVESPGESARVSFHEGKLAHACIGQEDRDLAFILHRSHKINSGQFKAIRQRTNQISDKEFGLLLINAGYVSQEDILVSLQQYFTEVVQQLFTWVEGVFQFDNDMLPPNDRINARLDLENLILKGSRQMREWDQLQDEIPSLEMALKFTDRPGTNLRNINLSVEEWRVVSYINPRNTIRQVASATKMNELEIRRIVYNLLQAGLVNICRPEGFTPPASSVRVFPTDNKEEQKSLVNRLINRIRSL